MFVRMVLSLVTVVAAAQTTQGLIGGRVVDRDTGAPIQEAQIRYFRWQQGAVVEKGSGRTNAQGYFALSFLSPGTYQLRVQTEPPRAEVPKYQPQEIYDLELFVAARLEVNFALRPIDDVWAQRTNRSRTLELSTSVVVHYYAADVATLRSAYIQLVPAESSPLEATVSYVVDPRSVENLPLAGRDIYTTLVLQPAVTADAATSRGAGLSVNGQRPTSANFLLDGVENNNHFLTGPLTAISPEAIQEYRLSISNFSAEYGGTGGFIANAVTRSGGNAWHGLLFGYLGNEHLNANTFVRNAEDVARPPDKELHAGYQAGGPILRDRLFFSSEFEQFRSRGREDTTRDAETNCVPTIDDLQAFQKNITAAFPSLPVFQPVGTRIDSAKCSGTSIATDAYLVAPTVSIDRSLGLERLDFNSPSGSNRMMLRVDLARGSTPDFVFSPYQGFNSRLSEDSTGAAIRFVRLLGPKSTNELRLGWTNFDLHWNRPYSLLPSLQLNDDTSVRLPGSELPYSFADRENDWEGSDSMTLVRGAHVITAGGGVLLRRPHSFLPFYGDGYYQLLSDSFPRAFPTAIYGSELWTPNAPSQLMNPDFHRSYSNNQFDVFAQDVYRVTAHLAVSVGIRYESYGSIRNTGAQDAYVQSGALVYDGGHSRSLYAPDRGDWAGRFGISYALGKVVMRAAYGTFYDRPFDNLFQSTRLNNVNVENICVNCNFEPFGAILSEKHVQPDPPSLLWSVADNLKSPRVQVWHAEVERPFSHNLTGELTYMGAVSRDLITTDVVRSINYESNLGTSRYHALTSLARYRSAKAQFQVAYTWSHSIDNQSDPLLGHVLDLNAAAIANSGTAQGKPLAKFSIPNDWRVDRGNSDFDQRQNLVFYSTWQLPRGWQLASLAGIRSGFPVNPIDGLGRRLNVQDSQYNVRSPSSDAGAVYLLNTNSFRPPAGLVGTLGRNSIAGPGFWNADVSIAKSFALPRWGETRRLQVRADCFNIFNHANLGPPLNPVFPADPMKSPSFGEATYGQTARQAAFPALIPLAEQQRRIELQIKLYF